MKKLCLIMLGIFIVVAAISLVIVLVSKDRTISLKDKVALVKIQGPIIDAKDIVDELRDFTEDESIKGIIIRVDSPGGAVAPSQEIFNEVRRAAESKKVVVSMGSVAASGGYYVSLPANKIIANPGTITGSIGVIMEIPNLEGLMGKVGIKTEVIKSGKHKDIGSAFRQMSADERAVLQSLIDDVYEQFVADVAENRGMTVDEVKELADGRIYSGRQAKDLGLVDDLGGLQEAIDETADLAGIEGEPEVVEKRKKVGFFEMIENKLTGINVSVQEVIPRHLSVKYMLSP